MNKIKYLFATLLAITLLNACEDVYDHVAAPPQAYEQETEQSVSGFTFALGADVSAPIVFDEEALADETPLEAIKTTATPQLAEGATVTFIVEASDTEDFAQVVELTSVSDQNSAYVTAATLNEAAKSLYGKAPEARDLYLRAASFINDGSNTVRVPGEVVLGPVTVTPVGPVIETEYYLIGDINGWNIENLEAHKFNHSGKDVYEDPIFTILVNNVTGYFKIVPKSSKDAASWDGVLGNPVDGNTALEGDIILDGAQAMRVTEPGWVKITLNMMEYTYTIEIIGEMNLTLYVPGGHQGWDPASAPTLYNRNFDFKYSGYVYFADANTEFKFTAQPGWDGANYGDGGDGTISTDGGNLKVAEAGMYKIDVDLTANTYTLTKTEWGLIGDATDGGWDNSTPMSYDPATGLWSVTTTLKDGTFKFRANNAWDINLGGDLNNLSYGGDNIQATAGTYTITLDLSDPEAFKATVVSAV
ncbi:MAG TPA: SusF/SusE family outer membrane protein [Proteiniphilum sp.]|nr:SusF/SusE family outer membrane protein [Proteiniphilum sp.]HPJ50584.1 SusF/SusE family outer membrane protein [Proteiniphilum sp.]HPR18953.1 SusF/SusE family outer membrane protein [Proteiniphilum sp.]